MKISTLLNEDRDQKPVRAYEPTQRHDRKPTSSGTSSWDDYTAPATSNHPSTHVSTPPSRRKDMPKTEPRITSGDVRYAPFVCSREETMRKMRKFDLQPEHGIADSPKHIPYTSEKKAFHIQTGRDRFEVFYYTFKHRDSIKEWTVMWDYNIGLVRVTPFFKALGYAKTIPAKAIGMNPGLKEMSHSITGGALAAQGYWMPFEAARALASKFCWEIRYALVPLFGPGFVNTCTRPEHQEANDFTIDQEVVRACQEEIKSWTQSGPVKSIRAPRTPLRRLPVPPTSAPRTPNASDKDVSPKDTRPRSSSPNGPDTSSSAETLRATRPTFTQPDWRAGNASTSPAVSLPASSPSPTPSSTAQSTTNTNDSSASKRTRSDVDWDEASSAASSEGRFGGKRRCIRKSPGKFGAAEVRAAYALMGLRES